MTATVGGSSAGCAARRSLTPNNALQRTRMLTRFSGHFDLTLENTLWPGTLDFASGPVSSYLYLASVHRVAARFLESPQNSRPNECPLKRVNIPRCARR